MRTTLGHHKFFHVQLHLFKITTQPQDITVSAGSEASKSWRQKRVSISRDGPAKGRGFVVQSVDGGAADLA